LNPTNTKMALNSPLVEKNTELLVKLMINQEHLTWITTSLMMENQ